MKAKLSHQEIKKESIKEKLHPISKLIRERKTTYASSYSDKRIPFEVLEEIITNALWAPTHKMTQPWRFELLTGTHHEDLGKYMLDFYKKSLSKDQFPESRYQTTLEYPKNATMLVIVFRRSERIEIPEWEEIAAISCAVQNMWLTCTALDIGCYWDTAIATIQYCDTILDLKPNEKCLGIFYMGYISDTLEKGNRKRKSLSKKMIENHKK